MTCRECELALGMDEAMEESGAAVARHLAECDSCGELSRVMRANAGALRDMASDPLPRLLPRRRARWQWAAAAAALVLTMLGLSRMWPVEKIAPPPVQVAVAAPKVEIPPAPALPKRRARKRPRRRPAPPLTVKMFTSDPNVVIYWLIDSKEGTE
jgi:hypothetical protein